MQSIPVLRWLANVFLLTALLWSPCSPGIAEVKRPNILIAIADDLTWYDVGCYGNPDVKTPHLDQLAKEGIRLTGCFTSTAMCAPTRQQLYTGIYPVRNGAYPNHSRVYQGTKSVVHYFRELGYRVGLAGKRHFGPQASFPFEFLSPGKNLEQGKVNEFLKRDPHQPFLLIFASNEPHQPWNKGDAKQYDSHKLTIPPWMIDTPITREQLTHYYAEVEYLDHQMGALLQLLRDAGLEKNTITLFTSEQGAQFPFGKWTCYDLGLKTATIVRWPGKIQPGSESSALVQYVDIVPTLLEAAQGNVPQGLDGKSFLKVLTGEADSHRSFVFGVHTTRGIIKGSNSYPIRSVRSDRFKYIRNLQHQSSFRNIVTETDRSGLWNSWKEASPKGEQRARFYQHRPREELYDLQNDPWELHNLADDSTYHEQKAKLNSELQSWMKQQGDLGHLTEMKAKTRQGKGKKQENKSRTK